MPVFAGLTFRKVPSNYVFREETVIVLRDCETGTMFVRTCPKQGAYVTVKRYRHNPTRLLNAQPNSLTFEYFVFHRITEDLPSIIDIGENIKIEFTKENKLWSNRYALRKGVVVDMQKLDFYIYAMINENTGAVYFDYDHCEKKFINPMNFKAATYNGCALSKSVHHNRTMYHYAVRNFPLKPHEWFSVKIGDLVNGRENASNQASRLSVEMVRNNFLVLNRIYGSDSHFYRLNHSGQPIISMQDYVALQREDTYDALEKQMVF